MEETRKLSEVFDECWATYQYFDSTDDPTVSDKYQEKVDHGISESEKAIFMVNQLSLFSTNEDIEEVATAELRYMMLSALHGYFTIKKTKGERMDTLMKSQVCFGDFLRLCNCYKVTSLDPATFMSDSATDKRATKPAKPDLLSQVNSREAKIKRFKEQKEREKKLEELYEHVKKDHVDDEVKRDYYMTLLDKWVGITVDELESIKMELPFVEQMSKMQQKGDKENIRKNKTIEEKPPQPMRPFILTKDALQAKVYGLGYPSIPTYSIDQWYDQQAAAGRLPKPGEVDSMMNAAMSHNPGFDTDQKTKEEIEKEENIERDDPETLAKARSWDDWKDDHRTGWGNTDNRG